MPLELQARTDAGRRLVSLAEALAADFATRAGDHDRDASYPHEDVEALRESGFLRAPIPEELGGMGVESVHDLLVASSRLARGEPSVAIGANMHLIPLINVAQRWRAAMLAGDEARAAGFASSLESVARSGVVLAMAISEPDQDLTRPSTRAVRTEDGWSVSGHKVFCTMSPAADVLYASVTFEHDAGELYGYVRIPTDAPGVHLQDDWDALGMRASGSNSVVFDDVRLPDTALRGGFPAGRLTTDFIDRNLVAGALHAASSVGIAEEAARVALAGLARRGHAARTPRAQMLAAESSIQLSSMRAMLQRAGTLLDEHHVRGASGGVGDDEMVALFAEVQAAKTFVNEAAVRVVDRALALSGGAGYMTRHPLSRAYRDVRAGAFMHPLGANRAYDLLGELALGMEPSLR
jgi:alkylation response protein AidB-like acyl-CoA dehydrogenase